MPRSYRLIATVRVKNEAWILEQWLARTAQFVDGIVALDDGSTDASVHILKAHPKVLQVIEKPAGSYWKEQADRNRLLEATRHYNPEWMFLIDPDEIMDARLPDHIDEILRDPTAGKFAFKEITLWRSTDYYRIDHPEKYHRDIASICGIVRMNPALRWVPQQQYTQGARLKHMLRKGSWLHVPNVGSEKLRGVQGETRNYGDLVKLHYHFANWDRAWRTEMRYVVYRAIATKTRLNEVETLINTLAHRLSEDGLELAPVDPKWGVIPISGNTVPEKG